MKYHYINLEEKDNQSFEEVCLYILMFGHGLKDEPATLRDLARSYTKQTPSQIEDVQSILYEATVKGKEPDMILIRCCADYLARALEGKE